MNNEKAFKKVSYFLLLSLFALIVSCGKKGNDSESACWNRGPIVNGVEVKKDGGFILDKNSCTRRFHSYPAVVSLRTPTGLCTGTFINDYTVLSAAHCFKEVTFEESGKIDIDVVIEEIKAVSTQVIIHPQFLNEGINYKYDIAVAFFPRGTSSHFIKLSKRPPTIYEMVQLIGFGNNRFDSGVMKGGGLNVMEKTG